MNFKLIFIEYKLDFSDLLTFDNPIRYPKIVSLYNNYKKRRYYE